VGVPDGPTVARAITGAPVDVTDALPIAARDVSGDAVEADGVLGVVRGDPGLLAPDPGGAGTATTGTGEAVPGVRTVGSEALPSPAFTVGVAGGAETTGVGMTVDVGSGVGV
jgi:hypothetical protein